MGVAPQGDVRGEGFVRFESNFAHRHPDPFGKVLEGSAPVAVDPNPVGPVLVGEPSGVSQGDFEWFELNRLKGIDDLRQKNFLDIVPQKLERKVKVLSIFHPWKAPLQLAASAVCLRWKRDADEKPHS